MMFMVSMVFLVVGAIAALQFQLNNSLSLDALTLFGKNCSAFLSAIVLSGCILVSRFSVALYFFAIIFPLCR
jgi:hypothetical protein